MKKIILGLIAVCAINAPAYAQEIRVDLSHVKNAVVVTGETAWRVVKYPFALTGLLVRDIVNGEPIRTLQQAWSITSDK